MVDTVRTEAALLALLDQANSNTNLGKSTIDRQVLRDLVASISSIGGGIGGVVEDLTPQLGGDLDMNGSDLVASSVFGPAIRDRNRTSTVPTLLPGGFDDDTGWGAATADVLSGIAGGKELLRLSEGIAGGDAVEYLVQLQSFNNNGASLPNVAASATVPSVQSNQASSSAGLGGVVGAATLIGGDLERITVDGTGIGFFATTPAARPTGVAVTAAGIHAALVTLGLITP